MFIFLLKYTKGLEAIDKFITEHAAFLDKYYAKGNFICSGRRTPRTGGVIICKAGSFEEAKKIADEDPFTINEIAEYEIIEFQPSKYVDEIKSFVVK